MYSYEVQCLPPCDTVYSGNSLPTFWKNFLSPISGYMTIEAERYSEMSVYFYQTILHHIPRDIILHSYRRQKLKSHIHLVYLNY
jgi:hypothetical protein